MDRRHFLYATTMMTAGAAFSLEFPSFAKVLKEKGKPNLKVGILSDIHITDVKSSETFRHALEYFREKEVDAVLIAGDMADRGLKYELENVAAAWYSVFPDDTGLNGSHVEKLFIYGNHDVNSWRPVRESFPTREDWAAAAIVTDRKAAWESIMHEPYSPIYIKNVKGYNFIGAHWCNDRSIDGLSDFMKEHETFLKGRKPFFYFQHPHPKNTCNGPWAWGQDDGTVTSILSRFHNCIAFSGHSHCPLTDERDLWQEEFTSVGTASLRYMCPIGARENSHIDGGPKEHSEMGQTSLYEGRQGMLMYVYDNCIALEKREFVYDEPLRDNWIIPLGVKDAPMSFENRAKTAPVPQFLGSDKVTVTRGMGMDRAKDEHMQVTVHFPSVLKKTHGVRAFDYEVKIVSKAVDLEWTSATKRVYSPKYYLGEEHDGGEVTCVFAETELPRDFEFRFEVRPCESFGGKGEAICSPWFRGLPEV